MRVGDAGGLDRLQRVEGPELEGDQPEPVRAGSLDKMFIVHFDRNNGVTVSRCWEGP